MKSSIIISSVFWILNIKMKLIPSVNLMLILAIAILFDLCTGIAKAKLQKVKITSAGYRDTIIKFIQYFGALAIVVALRFVMSKQPELLEHVKYADYIVSGVLCFSVFIEATSALENISELDKKSPFSRYLIQPLLRLLTFQIKNNPFKKAVNNLEDETPKN
jgi:hypothetical protein